MSELNNEEFQNYFMKRSHHFLGQAFVAWIESLQQVAYNLALQEYQKSRDLQEYEKTLENEEESDVSISEANDTEQ